MGAYFFQTVLNALVTVITQCAPVGACINCLNKAWKCCLSSSKYHLCRTAMPFSWCPHALVRLESHESSCVMPIVCQCFSVHHIYVVPPQSWGDRSDTKHSKCLLLGGRRLNQLTLIPKPKGSGGARAATAQVGPANNRNDTKRCLPVEASLRPGEAVPW